MGFLGSFLGLIGASAVFVGADVKERWDEIDRERQRIAANPAPPPEMRGNLRDKYESEWHRGDNTHFPEEYLPALESDPEVLYWWIELLAEREIMLMYGKEASNRKQEIDRQHYTIPNQRPKDKHCGKI